MSVTGEPGGRPVKSAYRWPTSAARSSASTASCRPTSPGCAPARPGDRRQPARSRRRRWRSGRRAATSPPARSPDRSARPCASAPYQAVRTRDGYLAIGAATPNTWTLLCALGAELAEDERFVDNPRRMQNVAALIEIIEGVTTTRTSAGGSHPGRGRRAVRRAQFHRRGHGRSASPGARVHRRDRSPARWQDARHRLRSPERDAGPSAGRRPSWASTRRVLTELGLSATEIDDLRQASAI